MTILYKQPSETKIFDIDFVDQLTAGDALSTITSVTESTSAITIASTSIVGTAVRATYSGGVDGTTYHIVAIVTTSSTETIEADVFLRVIDSASTTYETSYFGLLERVGHFLFGIRSGYTGDQVSDIEDCIGDGLRRVYAAHDWSFFKPIKDITTTAPYTTGTVTASSGVVTLSGGTFPSWAADGLFKASNNYYSVASRDGNTQITLDDTSVTLAAGTTYQLGRPEIPLAAAVDAIANDSDLTYYPDQNELYPPVRMRHDSAIRTWQQDDPYFDRPVYYSVRTVEFDPTTGSRKRLAFYPTPDAAYILRVPMLLRQTMIDETNLYPVGGEVLTQVITEACLAAAEHNYDETEAVHEKRFLEMLPLAIQADRERSSPTSLGPDAPRSEQRLVSDYWLRSSRIGSLTLDGETL
jgi:hypothetical protein